MLLRSALRDKLRDRREKLFPLLKALSALLRNRNFLGHGGINGAVPQSKNLVAADRSRSLIGPSVANNIDNDQ
jgi:hypothetical protein